MVDSPDISIENEMHPLKPLPERIMRFYGNTNYALECIQVNKITFVRSTELNDPFDPWLGFVTDFNDDYNLLIACIKKHYPKDLNAFRARVTPNSLRGAIKNVRERASKLIGRLFVFSTCEVSTNSRPEENLYMWSHYGNGHRGIAIEFNAKLLNDNLKDKGITDNVLWDIYYSNNTPKISCHDIYQFAIHENEEHFSEKIQAAVRVKSKFWETELEWRLVENSDTHEKILSRELPEGAITKVYIGCRTDAAIKAKIVSETKRLHPHAEIYEANKLFDRFGLSFASL